MGWPECDICIQTINGSDKTERAKIVRDLELLDYHESETTTLSPLLSVSKIPVDKAEIPTQQDVDQFYEFRDLVIPDIDSEVELLIGIDNVKLHKPLEVIEGLNDYFATRTGRWMGVELSQKRSQSETSQLLCEK